MLGNTNSRIFMLTCAIVALLVFYYFYLCQTGKQAGLYNSSREDPSIAPILGFQSFPKSFKDTFHKFIAEKTNSKDPKLIAYLKSIIIPPSKHKMIKLSRPMFKTPQAEEIDNILNKTINGFFIEAGAFDGEVISNSIFFEMERDWTGLLVEPDPFYFTQVVGKNRNCWAINACLSPYDYVSQIKFEESTGSLGKLKLDASGSANDIDVPCFPLESILLALGRTTVDFFSLDVEGAEVPVLKTIPFKNFHIKTLAVEYRHGIAQQYLDVMKTNGYEMTKKIAVSRPDLYVEDFIFVKK